MTNSQQPPPPQSNTFRKIAALLIFVLTGLVTSLSTEWPEVLLFTTDAQAPTIKRLAESPVHLADDVMISLRSGYILNETGKPAFNRSDLAQPSTSYISPYVYALLLNVFPLHLATAVYALLGLACVALTLGALVLFSRSTTNAILVATLLLFTSTNFLYALNGWDHLFQALFLTIATCIALRDSVNRSGMLAASVCLVLGSLFRPDGLLIASGVLFALYLTAANPKRFLIFGLLPFVMLIAAALMLNLHQFEHLTPTTARLKVGAAPSLEYSLTYLVANGVLAYSALTVFAAFLAFLAVFRPVFANLKVTAILLGCLLTGAAAAYNSDVFPGARMFWAPACVLAALITVSAPALFVAGRRDLLAVLRMSPDYSASPLTGRYPKLAGAAKAMLLVIVGLIVLMAFVSTTLERARSSVITSNKVHSSAYARQFVVAQWIKESLRPEDGPVGIFYLGISFHLPEFEIADFLGKSDEEIATMPVNWGPPGHNKWNIDKTLEKWNPQAIVPPEPFDRGNPVEIQKSLQALATKRDYGFVPAFWTNQRINRDYAYCYIPSSKTEEADNLGVLLRHDIATQQAARLKCL